MAFEKTKDKQVITLKDFSGGLNSNYYSDLVNDNESIDCNNVIWQDGYLRKIYGSSRLYNQIGGSGSTLKITGIHDFQLRDTTQELVVTSDGDCWNVVAGIYTSIKDASTAFTADYQQQIISFNDRVIGTNGYDTPWTWDGTTMDELEDVGPCADVPQKAKWICSFNDRVCLANYTDTFGNNYPARVAYSEIDDPLTWDLTDNYFEFETDDGQEITGMSQLGSNLVVFKSDSIGTVSGYGLDSWTVDRKFIRGVGCISGYTIKPAQLFLNSELVQVLVFLSKDGLCAFDGTNVYRLPQGTNEKAYKVGPWFTARNPLYASKAVGVYHQPTQKYYCWVTDSGETTNKMGFIYDFITNSFWPFNASRAFSTAIVKNSSTKKDEIIFGGYDGIVYTITPASSSLESATELLTNGNFETDADGVAPPTGWTKYGTPTTYESDDADKLTGNISAKIVTDAASSEGLYQAITTVPSARYILHAYVKCSAGGAVIEAQDSSNNVLATSSASTSASWTHITVSFTATGTSSLVVIRNNSTAASTFWVDDVSARNCDIDGYWQSKFFGDDYGTNFLRELTPTAGTEDDYYLNLQCFTDNSDSPASSDNLYLYAGGAVYDTAIYDVDVYPSSAGTITDDLPNVCDITFNRISFKVRNAYGAQDFRLYRISSVIQGLGSRFYG